MKLPVYAIDLNGGRRFIGHATTARGAATVAGRYVRLAGKVYESDFGRFVAPVLDVRESK